MRKNGTGGPRAKIQLEVSRTRVWKRMGTPGPVGDAALLSAFEEAYRVALASLSPCFSLRGVAVRGWGPDGVAFDDGVVIPSRTLAALAAEAREVRAMAVTVGPAVDGVVAELHRRGDDFAMMVVDAAASVAAEELMSRVYRREKALVEAAGGGLTKRISPGFGDFSLAAQAWLLRAAGGDELGIRLTDAFMMLPRKSVTALAAVTTR